MHDYKYKARIRTPPTQFKAVLQRDQGVMEAVQQDGPVIHMIHASEPFPRWTQKQKRDISEVHVHGDR